MSDNVLESYEVLPGQNQLILFEKSNLICITWNNSKITLVINWCNVSRGVIQFLLLNNHLLCSVQVAYSRRTVIKNILCWYSALLHPDKFWPQPQSSIHVVWSSGDWKLRCKKIRVLFWGFFSTYNVTGMDDIVLNVLLILLQTMPKS